MNTNTVNELLLGDIRRAAEAIAHKCAQFKEIQTEDQTAIAFSIDDKEFHDYYARKKGFQDAGDMARFAMIQYENRYSTKSQR